MRVYDQFDNEIEVGDTVCTVFDSNAAKHDGLTYDDWINNGGSETFTIGKIEGPFTVGDDDRCFKIFVFSTKIWFWNIETEKI